MRIFQVINVRWFNATSWYALTLSKLMAEAGHDVLVLTLKGTETHQKAIEYDLPYRTYELNTSNPYKAARLYTKLAGLTETYAPDIVNCHRGESFILWGLLKRRFGFKLVRTRGDQRPPKNNIFNRWLHRDCADAVIATNTAMARYFRESLGVPPDKLWLIHGGVDREKFAFDQAGRERVRKEFGFGPNHRVIGLLGRFDEVKGQRELIDAVAELHHKRGMANLRLFFIGFETATSESEVRKWIREADIEEITVISGERDDVTACISALDVGVVASKWSETIARAALEIMACGRPLIATRVGVLPDLLPEEALVPAADVPALAGKLARVAGDELGAARLAAEESGMAERLGLEDFLSQSMSVYMGLLT